MVRHPCVQPRDPGKLRANGVSFRGYMYCTSHAWLLVICFSLCLAVFLTATSSINSFLLELSWNSILILVETIGSMLGYLEVNS